jgi:ankyrin repeat protein
MKINHKKIMRHAALISFLIGSMAGMVTSTHATAFQSSCVGRDEQNSLNLQLIEASKNGDSNAMYALILQGANASAKNNCGETPLHWASSSNNTGAIFLLLDHGADINARNNEGETPLHWATWGNNVYAIYALLQKGANSNARNNEGETSLHYVAKYTRVESMRASFTQALLSDRYIEKNAKDNADKTPLSLAKENGHSEIVQLLIR